jgi:hypothetical protein
MVDGKRYEVRSAYGGTGIPQWRYTLWDTQENCEVRVNHWEASVFYARCAELNAAHEAVKK